MFNNKPTHRVSRMLIAGVIFGLSVTVVHAQSTYPDMNNLLDAQILIYQKQEQLAAARRRLVDPSLTALPQVVAVYGFEGDLKAKLMLSSGASLLYSEGESINPYMKVAAITTREVVVAVSSPKSKKKPLLAPLTFMAGSTNLQQGGMGGMGGQLGQQAPLPEGLLPPMPVPNAPLRSTAPTAAAAPAEASSPAPQPAARTPSAPPATAPAAVAPAAAAQPNVRPDQDLLDTKR